MKSSTYKIQVAFYLLIFMCGSAYPQQVEIITGKIGNNVSTTSMQKMFAHDADYYYIIKHHSNEFYLEKLDQNLDIVREERVRLFEGMKTFDLQTVVNFYNELYIVVSRKRINDETLYYQRISKDNLQALGELTEIATVKCIRAAWPDFHFALSRQEKVLMMTARIKFPVSNEQYNEFYVFGEGMQLIWKKKDSFEFSGIGPRENKYLVDEIGNVSIVSLLKRESILSLIRQKRRNLYSIYRYTDKGKIYTEYPVTLGENYIRGIDIIAGDRGELICAGLYSELYRSGVRGTFFFKLDAMNSKPYDENLNEFDEGFLSMLAKIKEPTLDDREVIMYGMSDLVLRSDGSIMCIAEQVFSQSYNTYNNIIVLNFNNSGGVNWHQIVEKNQDFKISSLAGTEIETDDYRDFIIETGFMNPNIKNNCSYALMAPMDRTGIVLFYNDNLRNLDPSHKKRNFNNPRKSYLLAAVIDDYGNISKHNVLAWKKKALFLEPIRYYDPLYNSIIIPAFKDRRYNYYKFTVSF